MLEFPYVPKYWSFSNKFKKLNQGYDRPKKIIGFDTETNRGKPMTMQFVTEDEEKIILVTRDNILDKFLEYLSKFFGFNILYCFNAQFDLPQVLFKYIEFFKDQDFEFTYGDWNIKVFASRNWFAIFKHKNKNLEIKFIDIHSFFTGSLKRVSESFGLDIGKLDKPDELGYKQFKLNDKIFVAYALMDAQLCFEMGIKIQEMHEFFDIPQATSSANFAEKVFRRKFLRYGQAIQFTPNSAMRLAEYAYHGGKNGYYLAEPSHGKKCYEYDFNSAYPAAMYLLPTFIEGQFQKTCDIDINYVGVYKIQGRIKRECPYGILYDPRFQYFRNVKREVTTFTTSFELIEAINSGEFELDRCSGYIWKPEAEDNPIKRYVQYFWEKKNKLNKNESPVEYLFTKLLLNSFYGKFIQRNPYQNDNSAIVTEDFGLDVSPNTEIAGGLYHPFIGALITGHTRSRLHQEEHILNALDVSTDSVKCKTLYEKYNNNDYLGAMQLQKIKCKECGGKETKNFNAYFVRNRLNVIMCPKDHPIKGALHGFWSSIYELKAMAKHQRINYQVNRMPMVREAMLHSGKPMFEMYGEDKLLHVDWSRMIEI